MRKKAEEWLKQSHYDREVASYLYHGEKYFYSVFMCHLAVEKALKGLFQRKLRHMAPKTHNFTYLLKKCELRPPTPLLIFLVKLNGASIVTRYPENLEKLSKHYTRAVVKEILIRTREALQWIENQY